MKKKNKNIVRIIAIILVILLVLSAIAITISMIIDSAREKKKNDEPPKDNVTDENPSNDGDATENDDYVEDNFE